MNRGVGIAGLYSISAGEPRLHHWIYFRVATGALLLAWFFMAAVPRAASQQANTHAGVGDVIVHGQLGGIIFGFDKAIRQRRS